MLTIFNLTNDEGYEGKATIAFFTDTSNPKEAKKDFTIVVELFRAYVANNYCVETGLTPDEAIKYYKQIIKQSQKEDYVIDGYMMAYQLEKGYQFGLTQKKKE